MKQENNSRLIPKYYYNLIHEFEKHHTGIAYDMFHSPITDSPPRSISDNLLDAHFLLKPSRNISTLSERELFGLHNLTWANELLNSRRNSSNGEP